MFLLKTKIENENRSSYLMKNKSFVFIGELSG